MSSLMMPSGEGFEDYCLRVFKHFLHGDLFPYSLRETYTLVFTSWDEAVKELVENGVEGFSYQKCPDGEDYFLCMYGFTQHVVMQDKSLELLACSVTRRTDSRCPSSTSLYITRPNARGSQMER